jgi:hypothetical protein
MSRFATAWAHDGSPSAPCCRINAAFRPSSECRICAAAKNPVVRSNSVGQGGIKLQEPRGAGVAEISNLPAPTRFLQPADWKSAIQQSGTLRYFPSLMQP